jgi:hypothetical protein
MFHFSFQATLLAAACAFGLSVVPAQATTLTGTVDYDLEVFADDTVFGSALGTLDPASVPGGDLLELSILVDTSFGLFGNLFITDLTSFDVFLEGELLSYMLGTGSVALTFGDLTGTGTGLFGAQVVVTLFDPAFSYAGPDLYSGAAAVSIGSVVPIPLPAGGLLLLTALAGTLAVQRRIRKPV